jgi:hypothetical protein
MKNKIIIPLLLVAVLLTACGGSQNNFNSNFNSNGNSQSSANGTGQAPTTLPLAEKLAVGTLKLENTSFALTPKEATDLLPLWQVYSSLITSDTAAQEEKDALAQQIQETMTSDQINNINSMNLTQRDIFSSMQELGLFTQQVNANATPSANGNNFGPGGGFPGGPEFFGGGGGGNGTNRNNGSTNRNGGSGFGGNGAQLSPQQIATAQARRNANGGNSNSNRFLTPLVTAVIKLLQSKVQAYP